MSNAAMASHRRRRPKPTSGRIHDRNDNNSNNTSNNTSNDTNSDPSGGDTLLPTTYNKMALSQSQSQSPLIDNRRINNSNNNSNSNNNKGGGGKKNSLCGSMNMNLNHLNMNMNSNRHKHRHNSTTTNSFLMGGFDKSKRRYRRKHNIVWRILWSSLPRRLCVGFFLLYVVVYHVLVPMGTCLLVWIMGVGGNGNMNAAATDNDILVLLEHSARFDVKPLVFPSIQEEQTYLGHLRTEQDALREHGSGTKHIGNTNGNTNATPGRWKLLEEIAPEWYHRFDEHEYKQHKNDYEHEHEHDEALGERKAATRRQQQQQQQDQGGANAREDTKKTITPPLDDDDGADADDAFRAEPLLADNTDNNNKSSLDQQLPKKRYHKAVVSGNHKNGSSSSSSVSSSRLLEVNGGIAIAIDVANKTNTNNNENNENGSNDNAKSGGSLLLPLRTIHNMDQLGAEYSSCGLGDGSNNNNTATASIPIPTATLVVQTSIERMQILAETCSRWANDPIIAVVFVPHHDGEDDDNDHAFLLDLLHMSENALLGGTGGEHEGEHEGEHSSCPNLTLVRYNADRGESLPGKYPVNRLRNVGLDLVTTSHVLMMDVDFVPSKDLEGLVRDAISSSISNTNSNSSSGKKIPRPLPMIRSSDRTRLKQQQQQQQHKAIVVPAFEKKIPGSCSDSNDPASCISKFLEEDGAFLPRTFAELKECYTSPKKECVVFQSEYNWDGHSTTLSDQWMNGKWYDDDEEEERNNNGKTNPREKRFRRISCFHTARYEPYVILEWCPAKLSSSSSSLSSSSPPLSPREQQQEQLRLATPIAPYYDERFHGYGKNKIELVSHLRRSNYQFEVLPEGFLVHNPHPESSTKELWLNKHDQNRDRNRAGHSDLHSTMDALYSTFLGELDTKYSSVHKDTTKLCSV